jgi:predicted DNA-binding transcriptional regulator AlpA
MPNRDKSSNASGTLRPRDAADYLSIHEVTLRRRAHADPAFPQPRKIGPRTTVFIRSELEAFLTKLAHGSDL